MVPKEKMVVYLLIGHSNVVGVDAAHSDPEVNPRAWAYQWYSTKIWVPAKETKNSPKTGLSGKGSGGPGMPFLKGMSAAFPDYYFGVINTASVSSTCRGENQGGNGSGLDPADNRYWKGTYLYEQVLTQARAVQKDVTFGGILCMLGSVESTRTSETVCRAFSNDIAQLIMDLRADLGTPNLPFIMGEYEAGSMGDFAISKPLPAIIAAETKLIPSKLSYSATVNSEGIDMLDDHHYTGDKGQGEWAKRAIAVIKTKAFFPPVSGSGSAIPAKNRKPSAVAEGQILVFREKNMELSWKDKGFYFINGTTLSNTTEARPSLIKGLK